MFGLQTGRTTLVKLFFDLQVSKIIVLKRVLKVEERDKYQEILEEDFNLI